MPSETKLKETEIGMIPEDWEVKELKEILRHGGYIRGPFGSSLRRNELKSEGIPVYEQQHAIYGNREFRYFIDEEKFSALSRFAVQENDLIISCSGTLGKVSIISKKDPRGIISQAMLILRPDYDRATPKFLQYFLTSQKGYSSLVSRSSGSVQVNIAKRAVIEKIKLAVPNIQEQIRIVKVLSDLDDKIDLNRQMNKTLEQIAQTLFKHWFIDFEFPDENGNPYKSSGGRMVDSELGDIPEGWEVGPFAELAEVNKGDVVDGPFGSNLKSSDYTDSGIRLIHQENIEEFNFINEKIRFTSVEKADSLQRSVAYPKDIVVTKMPEPIARAARIPCWVSDSFIIMADCIRIRPHPEAAPSSYLLYLVNSKPFRRGAQSIATGTTRPRISLTQIKSLKIIIPPVKYRVELGEFLDKLESKRENNSYQIEILTRLRDSLLSKLMSGKIRVEC